MSGKHGEETRHMSETEKMVLIALRVPEELRRELEEVGGHRGVSKAARDAMTIGLPILRLMAKQRHTDAPAVRKQKKRQDKADTTLNGPQAAKMIGCSRQHVYDLCTRGAIEAQKLGGRWKIDRDSVKEYIDALNVKKQEQERVAQERVADEPPQKTPPLAPPKKLPFLTPPQAAGYAGVHQETVRRWIRDGRLAAEQDGRNYAIMPADLDEVIANLPIQVKHPRAIDRHVIEEDERRREIIQQAWDRVCQGEQLTHKYEGPADTLRLLTPEEREERRRRRGGA